MQVFKGILKRKKQEGPGTWEPIGLAVQERPEILLFLSEVKLRKDGEYER